MSFITNQPMSRAIRDMAKQLKEQRTYAERVLWSELRANRLDGHHFRQQQIIGGFIADFYCHKYRLVIELDGGVHEGRKTYDAIRDRLMQEAGVTVVRFTNEDVTRRLNWVREQIRRKLGEIIADEDPRDV